MYPTLCLYDTMLHKETTWWYRIIKIMYGWSLYVHYGRCDYTDMLQLSATTLLNLSISVPGFINDSKYKVTVFSRTRLAQYVDIVNHIGLVFQFVRVY